MQVKKRHTDILPQRSMDHFTDWLSLPESFVVGVGVNKNAIADEDVDKSYAKRWRASAISSLPYPHHHLAWENYGQYYISSPIKRTMMFGGGDLFEMLPVPDHGSIVLRTATMYGGGDLDITPDIQDAGVYVGRVAYTPEKGFLAPSAFYSSRPLKDELETAIEEAKYIISLPDNWDEEGAVPISQLIFDKAVEFLRYYSRYLYIGFGFELPIPEINPCKDGSIDLSWRTAHARMLINIRMQDELPHAFFYGDRYNNKMPIKGNVPLKEFSESLAVWMKYLV
jgi:hypothetical protein